VEEEAGNSQEARLESVDHDEGNDVIGDEISLPANKTARIVMTKPSVESSKEPEEAGKHQVSAHKLAIKIC